MIAKNLAALRKQLALTQNEFAGRLGIAVRAYVNYERGGRKPPYELLIKLSEDFDVNLNWLIAGKGGVFNGIKTALTDDELERKTAAIMKKYGVI